MNDIVTLSELSLSIKSSIFTSFPESLWVVAEISELNVNKSGHCYLELIEKEPLGIKIIARMRAVIWAGIYRNVQKYFRNVTGSDLSAGIKVLLLVQVEFHEIYGLSLNVKDIDPSYTIGDIARRKREVLLKLKEEGVLNMNKTIPFPLVPQRIAVISSETAAGYGDFIDTLHKNTYGFKFVANLFPAIMQGEQSEKSVIEAMDKIYECDKDYDVTVIIRGGGAQSELDSFNGYDLAFHITQFPIPVITGIGHERDETVADYVSNIALKTPTAVAEFLISKMVNFNTLLHDQMEKIINLTKKYLSDNINLFDKLIVKLNMTIKLRLNKYYNLLDNIHKELIKANTNYLKQKLSNLPHYIEILDLQISGRVKHFNNAVSNFFEELKKNSLNYLSNKQSDLNILEKSLDHLDPEKILKRGFTITSFKGKMIKKSAGLNEGEIIETLFRDGKVSSRIEKLKSI